MILSKARRLRFEKEERDGQKLTYERMVDDTGLSSTTLARLLKTEPLERVDAQTLSTLCRYFECGLCDLLEYIPDAAPVEEKSEAAA